MFVIATATIAGISGGGGLGEIMANQTVYDDSGVLAAALCVAAIALADRICPVARSARGLAPDGSESVGSPGGQARRGQS